MQNRIAGVLVLSCLVGNFAVFASPWLEQGDSALRHDLQMLADQGIFNTPITTWPIPLDDIADTLEKGVDETGLTPGQRAALRRIEWRLREAAEAVRYRVGISAGTDPVLARSFQSVPREEAGLEGSGEWNGETFSARLRLGVVANPDDDEDLRADNSYAAGRLGNWLFSVNTLDRWWGPAWGGGLILSNNARPFPAVVVARIKAESFDFPLLSWLGPWRLQVMAGQLEEDRYIPDTQVFAMRAAFKPTRKLEIGLSRAAQWCGEGRPCDLVTFDRMLRGDENRRTAVDEPESVEPGNQLAGFDARWVSPLADGPYAIYGEFIGEDQSGGFPSRYIGQVGMELWGDWGQHGKSYRLLVEFADTASEGFYSEDPRYNYAYNHGIYKSGYRYYARPIGYTLDNDSRIVSIGGLWFNEDGSQWRLWFRKADLNRDDAGVNTVSPIARDYLNVELGHTRAALGGELMLGTGIDHLKPVDDTLDADTEIRVYAQWTRKF